MWATYYAGTLGYTNNPNRKPSESVWEFADTKTKSLENVGNPSEDFMYNYSDRYNNWRVSTTHLEMFGRLAKTYMDCKEQGRFHTLRYPEVLCNGNAD